MLTQQLQAVLVNQVLSYKHIGSKRIYCHVSIELCDETLFLILYHRFNLLHIAALTTREESHFILRMISPLERTPYSPSSHTKVLAAVSVFMFVSPVILDRTHHVCGGLCVVTYML